MFSILPSDCDHLTKTFVLYMFVHINYFVSANSEMTDMVRPLLMVHSKSRCVLTGLEEDILFVLSTLPDDIDAYIQSHFTLGRCVHWLSHTSSNIDEKQLRLTYNWINIHAYPPPSQFRKVDIEFIKKFKLIHLQPIAENMKKGFLFQIADHQNIFLMQLHTVTHHILLPWNCSYSLTNRKQLIDDNCVKLIIDIYDYILRKPLNERNVIENTLEREILMFIWNFCETQTECREVFDLGGFELMLKSFHSAKTYASDNVMHYAIGALSG